MPKIRQHNEYFDRVKKPKCPTCDTKGVQVWGWYEYQRAKKYLVTHFCAYCFDTSVKGPLLAHADPCGCKITLQYYVVNLPTEVVPLQLFQLQSRLTPEVQV